MRTTVTCIIFLCLSLNLINGRSSWTRVDPEDGQKSVMELIQKYGYPAEEHHVTTGDGYILTMHRIPHGIRCGPGGEKKVVLVQHGLLSSSADWIISGPSRALGYILADNCYDVWLTNSRGNTYSRKHISFNPDKQVKFWDFSWHEMGVYDVPANIDYILHTTNHTSLFYIGHSQGTTQFFVFGSERPEYHSKVTAFIGLAPAAWLHHTVSPPLLATATYSNVIGWVTTMLGTGEFSPANAFLSSVGGLVCSDLFPLYQAMCANSLFIFAGYDSTQLDMALLPVLLGHAPAGASVKQMLHYSQTIKSRKFRQYDYGAVGNTAHYGALTPPSYNLTKINIPISLHHSVNDWLAQPKDVEAIAKAVPRLIGKHLVPHMWFNHLDFMWAIDANSLVYDQVLQVMAGFN